MEVAEVLHCASYKECVNAQPQIPSIVSCELQSTSQFTSPATPTQLAIQPMAIPVSHYDFTTGMPHTICSSDAA